MNSKMDAPTEGWNPSVGDTENTLEDAIVNEGEAQRKRLKSLQSRAARTGNALNQTSGGFLLHRGSYSRHFTDLDTAEALIVRMEGGRA